MGYLASMHVAPGDSATAVHAGYLYVSPEYFSVFDIPIVRGRAFTADEARARMPVVVLSQTTAHQLWPHGDALGQSLRIMHDDSRVNGLADYRGGPPRYAAVRVLGIARDAVNGWVGDADRHSIYFPTAAEAAGNILLVRVNGDAEAARRQLDRTLAAVDQIHTMEEIQAGQLYPFRALYWLSSAIGGLALVLTLSGLYGVLSYLVSQRTKEIGIRVALGASTARVTGMVLKESLRFTLAGTALGAVAALGVSRALVAQLDAFAFETFDGAAFGLGAVLVIAAAACAAYVPCRRAARIEPVTTLRYD